MVQKCQISLQTQAQIVPDCWSGLNKIVKTPPHPADLRLWNPAEASVEVQMFSAGQQLIDGIKLWAVTHVLMDVQDVRQNAARTQQNMGINSV